MERWKADMLRDIGVEPSAYEDMSDDEREAVDALLEECDVS